MGGEEDRKPGEANLNFSGDPLSLYEDRKPPLRLREKMWLFI